MAQERAVFVCDFGKGLSPLGSAAPCRTYKVGAELVDTPVGRVVRFGKKADGSLGRIVYRLQDTRDAAKLTGAQTPFAPRQGRFALSSVQWIGSLASLASTCCRLCGPTRRSAARHYLRPLQVQVCPPCK